MWVNLLFTWFRDYVVTNSIGEEKFALTEAKLYVPVVTLSNQDNAKLLQQLNLVLKEQLSGTNMNLSQKNLHKVT